MKLKGWVARDCDGQTTMYLDKPQRTDDGLDSYYGDYFSLPYDYFPSLTLDDEPIEVEIEIKEVKK